VKMEQQNSFIFNFKKFLLAFLLPSLLVIAVIAFAFNYFFEHKILLGSEINGAYKVNRIINEIHPKEIPIFGSSRAEGCYVPDSISANCFNYGLSGTQDDVILFFLTEELKKKKKTPIIINFDLDGLNSNIGDVDYYLYNTDYNEIKKLLDKNYKSIYNIPFLKYYGYFEINFKYYLNSKMAFTKIINHGGSFEKNILPKNKFKELVEERTKNQTIFFNNSILEKRLFELIESTNRKLIFVVAPYHPSFFENYKNKGAYESFKKKLLSFRQVKLLDNSRSIVNDSLFFDTSHLNYKGANIFSKQISCILSEL
jgi:hypothetical protein